MAETGFEVVPLDDLDRNTALPHAVLTAIAVLVEVVGVDHFRRQAAPVVDLIRAFDHFGRQAAPVVELILE